MKKSYRLVMALMVLLLTSFALGQVNLTLDWTYENNALTNLSGGAYNFTNDHFYACIYEDGAKPVHILNSDGTDSGNGLSITGLTLGTLNIFTVCVTTDGVIYGGTNTAPTPSLIRWANEAAVPTQQIGVTDMQFPRCMDVIGTGTDTKIFVTGEVDNGDVDILTTTDGINFAVTDTTITGLGKHGMAVAKNGLTVFVGQGYLGNVPRRCDKIGGVWTLSAAFTPSSADMFSPCPMGYWDEQDVLFVIDTREAGNNDNIRALNGSTGALITNIASGKNVGLYGYGTIDISPTTTQYSGYAYFITRAPNPPTGYICGKFSFSVPIPTPTPTALDSPWGLYE